MLLEYSASSFSEVARQLVQSLFIIAQQLMVGFFISQLLLHVRFICGHSTLHVLNFRFQLFLLHLVVLLSQMVLNLLSLISFMDFDCLHASFDYCRSYTASLSEVVVVQVFQKLRHVGVV